MNDITTLSDDELDALIIKTNKAATKIKQYQVILAKEKKRRCYTDIETAKSEYVSALRLELKNDALSLKQKALVVTKLCNILGVNIENKEALESLEL